MARPRQVPHQAEWYAKPLFRLHRRQQDRCSRLPLSVNFAGKRDRTANAIVGNLTTRSTNCCASRTRQSQYELIEATFGFRTQRQRAGSSTVARKVGNRPEILLMPSRPRAHRQWPGYQHVRQGYIYIVDGIEIRCKPMRWIHFPAGTRIISGDYYGLSGDGSRRAVDPRLMTRWANYNRAFFSKENGAPTGIVSVPPTINNTQFEQAEEDWDRKFWQRATRRPSSALVRWTTR